MKEDWKFDLFCAVFRPNEKLKHIKMTLFLGSKSDLIISADLELSISMQIGEPLLANSSM